MIAFVYMTVLTNYIHMHRNNKNLKKNSTSNIREENYIIW